MDKLIIKNVSFSDGMPKICLSLIGNNKQILEKEIQELENVYYDVIEWRIDYLDNLKEVESIAVLLEKRLPNVPIIFTFRNKDEGGNMSISETSYFNLLRDMISNFKIDFIDIEAFKNIDSVKQTINYSHKNGVKVILSNHDFKKTSSSEEIINRFMFMQELNGDINKIAVMPNDDNDVLILLKASFEMKNKYAKKPFISISMGAKGIISRIAVKATGSCLTFGSANKASAPGQINANELKKIIDLI